MLSCDEYDRPSWTLKLNSKRNPHDPSEKDFSIYRVTVGHFSENMAIGSSAESSNENLRDDKTTLNLLFPRNKNIFRSVYTKVTVNISNMYKYYIFENIYVLTNRFLVRFILEHLTLLLVRWFFLFFCWYIWISTA